MPAKKKRVISKKKLTANERHSWYFMISRYAVEFNETDQLIRTIMAAAMAASPEIVPGTILAQDLTLLRWVLRKMQENRMVAMEEPKCEDS